LQVIKAFHSCLPEFQKHTGCHPLLKAVMGGRAGTQVGLIEGFPLTARAQHIENPIGTLAIRHTRTASAKAVRVLMLGQQRVKDRP